MDGTEDDMIRKEDNDIPPSSVEHDISTDEDSYNDHLSGEEWDFVFDQSYFE